MVLLLAALTDRGQPGQRWAGDSISDSLFPRSEVAPEHGGERPLSIRSEVDALLEIRDTFFEFTLVVVGDAMNHQDGLLAGHREPPMLTLAAGSPHRVYASHVGSDGSSDRSLSRAAAMDSPIVLFSVKAV